MSDENTPSYMDQMYAAMRPHQRGYLNALGMGVMGARNLAEGAYNALLRPMQVYRGESAPDDVGANLNFAGFAMPGQVGLRRDPMRARDEAIALRMESEPGVSVMQGSRQVPPESIFAWGGEYPQMGGMRNFNAAANTATRMNPDEMRRLMRLVE